MSALLGPGDPPPYRVHSPAGTSRFVLLADHAGQAVPASLARLGLPQAELDRHIGWDVGIGAVTELLSVQLGALAIVQNYSRLVVDCNRPLTSPTSMPTESDHTVVPGNQGLDAEKRAARAAAIFTPYHERIAAELERRRAPIVIAMHSFTPVMNGFERPWQCGVLYHRDGRFALALKAALEREGLVVGDNEPYAVSDATDYAIPMHAERRGLFHVELELRQDLVEHEPGQAEWAARLARIFTALEPKFTVPV